jgi:tetratricopeptide (TPR) repeat protein
MGSRHQSTKRPKRASTRHQFPRAGGILMAQADAISLHRSGRYSQAEEAYKRALRRNKFDVDSLRNYGVLLYQMGRYEEAVVNLKSATTLREDDASLYSNLGVSLKASGRLSEALDAYDAAVRIDHTNATAHYCRSNLLGELGRLDESIVGFRTALELDAKNPKILNNLGLALSELGRPAEAVAQFDRAVEESPSYAVAYFNRANSKAALGDYESAIFDYQHAIRLDDSLLEAHNNLGNLYRDLRRFGEALTCFDRLLTLSPGNPVGLNNQASTLMCLRRFVEARPIVQKIIDSDPKNADAWDNMAANILAVDADPYAALECYDKAVALEPKNARIVWNRSLMCLLLGKYEEGLAGYESRWNFDSFARRNPREIHGEQWCGDPRRLCGKRLFVYGEQGAGDFIQFSRYVPLLVSLGAQVILRTPEPLTSLLRSSMPEVQFVSHWPEAGAYDFHCALMSIPYLVGAELRVSPNIRPCLWVSEPTLAKWVGRLGRAVRLRVGIAWSGNAGHANDLNRSIPLDKFMESIPRGVEIHSLQKEYRPDDIPQLAVFSIHDHSQRLEDYSDTAALISEMDLVVSVDTSVAHLAGALGKKCWVLLPYLPDWRWGLGNEYTNLYQSMRLFRQTQPSDWGPAIAQVNQELNVMIGEARQVDMETRVTSKSLVWIDELAQVERLISDAKYAEARAICERELVRDPHCFQALYHLASVMFGGFSDPESALTLLEQAGQINPLHAGVLNNVGVIFQGLGRKLDAVDAFTKALAIDPDHVDALFNRGRLLVEMDEIKRGSADLERLLTLRPEYAHAYAERAAACRKAKQYGEAIACALQGLAIDPTLSQCYNDIGICLLAIHRVDDAIEAFGSALEINPALPDVLSNRAAAYSRLNKIDAALADYEAALRLSPDNADIRFNLALLLLLTERYDGGWALYESRMGTASMSLRREYPMPRLTSDHSDSLVGARVLLTAEQGYGDIVQFSRYANVLRQRGAIVTLQSPPVLADLIRSVPWVDRVELSVGRESAFEHDYYCELLSVPHILGLGRDGIEVDFPYITAPPERVDFWQRRLPPKTSIRVGLAWSGNPKHRNDALRSMALSELLRALPAEYEYVVLQKGISPSDQELLDGLPIMQFEGDIRNFSDTAALCELVDVVLTVDTSIAHVAGALGRPTWVMLPYAPDWRWRLDGGGSHWYPTAKLFRQLNPCSWGPLLQVVRNELCQLGVVTDVNG